MKDVMESKNFMGYSLTCRRTPSDDISKLIDSILAAVSKRFNDVLQEDLEPTVISSLRLWPDELTTGKIVSEYLKKNDKKCFGNFNKI